MAATPVLHLRRDDTWLCSLCNTPIKDNASPYLNQDGLQTLRDLAGRWAKVDASCCNQAPYNEFRSAADRLLRPCEEIRIHANCRISFRTKLSRKESKTGGVPLDPETSSSTGAEAVENTPYRIRRQSVQKRKICFICNEETKNDSKSYNCGGLGRCSEGNAASKIEFAKSMKIHDETDKFHGAAKRLDIILSGSSCDVFAADVYYHKPCYSKFVYAYDKKSEMETSASEVMDDFFKLFHRLVIKEQNAYYLLDLLGDIKDICEEYGVEEPPVSKTYTLKKRLTEKFEDAIDFHLLGNRLVVYSSLVNPLTYSEATLQGNGGLRESELTKAFARMIRRKLSQRDAVEWPLGPDQLCDLLDSHRPLHCVYNAIAWSINPRRSMNAFGYATTTSKDEAEKLSALTQSWEKLVKGERSPLGTALSLTVHRITGSKEATTLLHRCGVGISYTDVRNLTNNWAKSITMEHKSMLPPGFVSGRTVHVTFDNSDGKQQTLTGSHTTHHTTGTIFQSVAEDDSTSSSDHRRNEQTHLIDQEEPDYGTYKIPKKRASPPPFPNFTDDYQGSTLLDDALQRNIAWVLIGAVGDACLDEYFPEVANDVLGPVGSWTSFMKSVTDSSTTKCKLEYLPVVPLPPGDNVIKWYMDMILQIADDLELDFIFAHADQAINSKMLIISWLHEERYDKIIPIMGGFHTILVNLKILSKKYGCLGLKDWWVDSGAIADGSVAQAFEGRHYARSVRLHKQSFEALLRHRMIDQDVHGKMDESMRQVVANLRNNPNSGNLQSLLELPYFKDICSSLMDADGTQAKMMVQYLKDVSAMLCLIAAVREKSIETHLAAERHLLPQCFAFGHVNYARYLTFQHVNLQNVKMTNKAAWEELVKSGFGGSISGQPFSTMHGDLITETTINREVKVRGGPMQGGYSTSLESTDTFIKTSHIIAKIRAKLKERLNVLTSSTHKEITIGARRKHERTVQDLVAQLERYFDPFLVGHARHMKTGEEIDQSITSGLLSSSEVGEKQLNEFIDQRLKATGEDRTDFFAKITHLKIKTGQEKDKKDPKALNIIKEDRQAFGVMVGKAFTPEEAHSHPLTTVPLALATPERDLRQGSKAALRNHLIEESSSSTTEPPNQGNWLIDGMAAVKTVPTQETWGDFADALLKFCTPPSQYKPKRFGIIFDSYSTATTKELTQRRRGFSGRRIHITSPEQSMPRGKDWDLFLRNAKNKTELIHFIVNYYKTDAVRSRIRIPLVVTEEETTWLITRTGLEELESCNHHEADTRVVLHASISEDPVIIRATDTDILILLSYAYSICKPSHDWLMKIDHRFVSLKKLTMHYGETVCQNLPAYHSITGCDTTSFPFRIGKVKPLKKMLKDDRHNLLTDLGRSAESFQDTTSAKVFFRTCMYSGNDQESFLETRIRMYNKQKVKSSCSILPDENSTDQHLKRSDLQAWLWHQCLQQNIEYPCITDRGWEKTDDGIKPVWFTCPQIPPGLSKKKGRRKRKNQAQPQYDADVENTVEEGSQPPMKKSTREVSGRKGKKRGPPDCATDKGDQSNKGQPPRKKKRATLNYNDGISHISGKRNKNQGQERVFSEETDEETEPDGEYDGDEESSGNEDEMEDDSSESYGPDSEYESLDSDFSDLEC